MTTITKLVKIAKSWHNKYGGICPECNVSNVKIMHTVPWCDDVKIRYHKCECGCTFTTIEDAHPEPAIEPIVKPKKRKSRKKRRKR